MLFNSFQFLIFFPIVVVLFFSLPQRYRWIWLLLASYYFYGCWKVEYLVLIWTSTLIDYYAGINIEDAKTPAHKKLFLALSLCSNLGILFTFKYFNLFNTSFYHIFETFNLFYPIPELSLLLPVGISFYTFQSLSYSVDVYIGQRKAERHLGQFALFLAFFPQLVAGPIERSSHLMPQFLQKMKIDPTRMANGLKLMTWGLFKKLVIADVLASYVNQVYNQPGDYYGWSVLLATYCFAFQIYCDFSGYSDIAIGASKVMGFDLMDNFKQPYFSKSVAEFWKRWHISLSTWFRDYLYIPLGGNQVSRYRWFANLLIVFLVSGLWHGANWTFAIWGLLHGVYLVMDIMTTPWQQQWAAWWQNLWTNCRLGNASTASWNLLKTLVTFHLVVFAWIFFRANTVQDAFTLVQHLFQQPSGTAGATLYMGTELMMMFALCIPFMLVVQQWHATSQLRYFMNGRPWWQRWSVYYAMVMMLILLGNFNQSQEFIYFQF